MVTHKTCDSKKWEFNSCKICRGRYAVEILKKDGKCYFGRTVNRDCKCNHYRTNVYPTAWGRDLNVDVCEKYITEWENRKG